MPVNQVARAGDAASASGVNELLNVDPASHISEACRADFPFNGSEEHYRALLQLLPAAVYYCNADGRIEMFNRAAVTLWGREPKRGEDQWCGSWKAFRPDGSPLPLDECPMAVALREGKILRDFEIIIERPDGTRRNVLPHPELVRDAQGNITGAINLLVDVTDQTRAIHAQKLLAAIVESSEDAIVSKTLDGVITSWNAGAERMFGYTESEAIGKSITMLIPQERLAEEQDILQRLRRRERVEHFETVRRTKDGDQIEVSLAISPVCNRAGRVIGASKVVRDITARKRAEEAVRANERIYRAIGESIDFGVWVCDPNGRNTYASPSFLKLVGLTQEQCTDLGWSSVLHPDDQEATIAAWNECTRTGNACDFEHRFRGVDGEWHPVLARGVPVRNERGEIQAWAGINLDISRSKKVEDDLRVADRRKDEFLAVLAHELRNPLAPICAGLELMKLAGDDPGLIKDVRGTMERQTRQMVRLIDDLLDVSRITRGTVELRKSRVELSTVINSAIETARPVIDDAGHQLTINLPIETVILEADPTRVSQVIANLLNNAAKYMPRGGHVELTAKRQAKSVLISIKDEGIGIPAEMLERIFDMFTQVDRSLEQSQSGLGIGLTLSKRLVEMHGGTVSARSAGEGTGSEFTIELPLAAGLLTDTDTDHDSGPAAMRKRRVLVVDDNEQAARVLGMLLKALGNEVRTANDGLTAVDLACEFQPHLVLLDIGMPNLNGFDTARLIRELPGGKEMILAALTGWGQEEDKRRTREAGFDHHLVKPVEPATLQRILTE